MKRRRPTRTPNAWQSSSQWRTIGTAAIRRWNAKRHLAPKCGATSKSTGGPCRQVAMANGRCYFHGGRTPKADGWHQSRWPNGKAPDAIARMNRKLADKQRAAANRAKRVKAMTPEQLAKHETWQRSHAPTSAGDRARKRAEREQDRWFRESVKKIKRAEREAELAAAIENGRGIFG